MNKELSIKSLEDVYAEIRRRLLHGEYLPGARLLTQELADEMGLSRTLIRETLQRFQGEGLVEWAPNRGVRVAKLSPEEIVQIYEVRVALEPVAVRHLIEKGPEAELIERLRNECEKARTGSTVGERERADYRFHRAILEGSGARVISEALEHRALSLLSFKICRGIAMPAGGESAVYRGHTEITDAIERGNADLAARLLREEIRGALERTRRALLEGDEE